MPKGRTKIINGKVIRFADKETVRKASREICIRYANVFRKLKEVEDQERENGK